MTLLQIHRHEKYYTCFIFVSFCLVFEDFDQRAGYPTAITVTHYNSGGGTPVGPPTVLSDPYFTNSGTDLCSSASTNGRMQTFNGGCLHAAVGWYSSDGVIYYYYDGGTFAVNPTSSLAWWSKSSGQGSSISCGGCNGVTSTFMRLQMMVAPADCSGQ